MVEPSWKRICGLHLEEDGTAGAVWLASDPLSSVVHCYDAALFRTEVMAVIAEGISARGRWIPLAWRKQDKEFATKLRDGGINVMPEPCTDSQQVAEVVSREVWQRMRTSRFRVDKRVAEWLNEYRNYYRDNAKVPLEGFPLMAATRHAIEMLHYARADSSGQKRKPCVPKLSVV